MKATTRERIEDIINNGEQGQKDKAIELLKICKECPEYNACTDCAYEPWPWWDHMVENKAKPKEDNNDSGLRDCIQNYKDRVDE